VIDMSWTNILKVDIDEARKLGEKYAPKEMKEFRKNQMRKEIDNMRNHVYSVAHDELITIRRMSDFPEKEKAIQFILNKVEIVKKMHPYKYISDNINRDNKESYNELKIKLRTIINSIITERQLAQAREAAHLA
tara:strand:+ start:40 stop:441 length:402 start_codon:yes stop_codon:yes gene_type:complete